MSEERMQDMAGSKGRFEREETARAVETRNENWKRILKAEQAAAFEKRKRRVLLVFGLVMSTAAMIAFIDLGLISNILGVAFSSGVAAGFGYFIGK